MLSYTLSPASLIHTHKHTAPLFNIHILLCIMNRPPKIILSNYLDRNLFQTAVLGQVKWRQFKQIDHRKPLKKRTRRTRKGRQGSQPPAKCGCCTIFLFSWNRGSYCAMNLKRRPFTFPCDNSCCCFQMSGASRPITCLDQQVLRRSVRGQGSSAGWPVSAHTCNWVLKPTLPEAREAGNS